MLIKKLNSFKSFTKKDFFISKQKVLRNPILIEIIILFHPLIGIGFLDDINI